jgi:hypothetical protein
LPLDLTHTISTLDFVSARMDQRGKLINARLYNDFMSAIANIAQDFDGVFAHRFSGHDNASFIEYEEGSPNFSLFKVSPNGWNISKDFIRYDDFVWSDYGGIGFDIIRSMSGHKYKTMNANLLIDGDFVLFPMQSNAQIYQILDDAIYVANQKNKLLVIKEHPFPSSGFTAKDILHYLMSNGIGSNKAVVAGMNVNIDGLINGCSEVWTINSAVGFRATLLGKRVVTLQRTDYSVFGNVVSSVFDVDLPPSVSMDKVKRYFDWYLRKFTVDINAADFHEKLRERLSRIKDGASDPAYIFGLQS